MEKFQRNLPSAFDAVKQRLSKGNPAIGILREHVILGFFAAEFGKQSIEIPEYGTQRQYDVVLCGHPLSIKTRTGDGGFKILWTADTEQVDREIRGGFIPEHDILLINIYWGEEKNSVFYIPLVVQKFVLEQMGRANYLSSATGTNNRGIEVSRKAVTALKAHRDTMSMSVNWKVQLFQYPKPWEEWQKFWLESR